MSSKFHSKFFLPVQNQVKKITVISSPGPIKFQDFGNEKPDIKIASEKEPLSVIKLKRQERVEARK